MDDLLNKATVQDELRSYINRIAVDELNKLSEPCYYPEIQKHYYEFLHLTGLTENDIRDSFAEFFRGVKEAPLSIHRDPKSQLVIFLMYYYLKKRDVHTYVSALLYYVLKAYSNLIHHRIKFCNPGVFKYTLEHLSKTHLFNREKSIAGAIYYITKQMESRYTDAILRRDAKSIALFMTEARHRVAQSIRSFQNAYYRFSKEGLKFRGPLIGEEGEEIEYQSMEKRSLIIDEITKNITVYREIDQKALSDAKSFTKIKESLSRQIVEELSNIKYQEKVKVILDLFIRDIKSTTQLCGKDFFKYIKSLMAIKKTSRPLYFKQEINKLLFDILTSIKALNSFQKLTPQSKSLHSSFLAYYIAMFVRNKLCQ